MNCQLILKNKAGHLISVSERGLGVIQILIPSYQLCAIQGCTVITALNTMGFVFFPQPLLSLYNPKGSNAYM